MNNTIQFNPSADDSNPWKPRRQTNFTDLVLRPEFEHRRLRLANGQTWLRILPAMAESAFGWLFPVQTLKFNGGQFTHPRTLKPNARCVFDHAYRWLRENEPHLLYSKSNKSGIRLLPDSRCAFWTIVYSDAGAHTLRLFSENAYDGSRGGKCGLGYEIWRKIHETDENGNRLSNAIHPKEGVLICVEKSQPKNAEFPNYSVGVGRQPCSVDQLLDNVSQDERSALCPLERVIREVGEEEEWEYLARVMDPKLADRIRRDVRGLE